MEDGTEIPDFAAFVERWNAGQGQVTPAHHRVLAAWLAGRLDAGSRRLLLMAFRGAGKSTIVGLFAAWLLLSDPNRRLLVLAADLALATKMVRNTKRIVEQHPNTAALKPPRRDQWAVDQFTVARPRELRDPSMLARGIDGNITGSRADVVICDDVEVPRTCDTAAKRADLREKLAEIDCVLVPDGTRLYIGTPHTYYSIYAEEARPEAGESRPFLDGYERMRLPVRDAAGAGAWPEVFSPARIAELEAAQGPLRFASQYLLRPTAVAAGYLDPDRLRPYDGEPVYREGAGRAWMTLNGVPLLSASAWWDPAFARPDGAPGRGDGSVVAVVFSGADGNQYLHRTLYLSVDPADPTEEAVQQCRAVVRLMETLNLPGVHVETNGIGAFLPGLLRAELRRAGVGAAVIAQTSTAPKARRILEAFDARLAAGRLFAHRSVQETPFVREMREWRPDGSRGHDDGLDAVAGCLGAEPLRFDRPALPAGRRPAWQGAAPVVASAEWDV
ncbi:phage terminase large subunit [Azospirillum halopraeferens]|uniref:phage terminase large subunit n=1 Tax=Azospirillum halopraeferens TaxID=34010 RepID=UPI00041CE2FF|nr:phage terminase large subunit [Azospirillum halopraeferens]